MKVSYNQLQEMTGKSYRTIKKKLDGLEPVGTGKNGANVWDSHEALPRIYSSIAGGLLNPQQEKAKLDQARRLDLERKDAEAKGILINSEETARIWSNMIVNARTKMMAIGSKLAPVLLRMTEKNEIKGAIDNLVYEVLEDLATMEADKK